MQTVKHAAKGSANMESVTEAAARWGVSHALVLRWIRQGRVRAAHRPGNSRRPEWEIPAGAKRPDPLPPGGLSGRVGRKPAPRRAVPRRRARA